MEQQYHKLSGKTILVIGSCGFARQPIFETFKRLNIKIVLVDAEEDCHATEYIHSFVQYPLRGGSVIVDKGIHGNEIFELLGNTVHHLDGCFTFFDEYIYLSALLCQKLGIKGISPDAVDIVKSKQKTIDILKLDHDTAGYSPLSFRIEMKEDIMKINQLAYPAVLKPEHGYFSTGVTEVLSPADCLDKYKELQDIATTDEVRFGIRYGNSMVLMEFLSGNSYQVEVIIFDGKLLIGIPSTMGPKFRDVNTGLPKTFSDTTCSTTCMTENLEHELITAGYKICSKIGLNNGVFNVEMKLTETGFKLIEVNGRVGCYRRCAVFKDTHGIDIFVIQALISCGIKPIFPKVPRKFAVGCYLYATVHGKTLSKTSTLKRINVLTETKEILFIKEFEAMNYEKDPYPIPFAYLLALGETVCAAKNRLIKICYELEFSNSEFNIENLTEMFY